MKRLINIFIVVALMTGTNATSFAQSMQRMPSDFGKLGGFNSNSTLDFLSKAAKANAAQNPFEKLPPIFDAKYPKAAMAKAMRDYERTVEDYRSDPASKLTPNEVLENMKFETRKMARMLAHNPRYKKEVRKANWIQAGTSCVNGILMGFMLVLCAPVATAYGGAGAGAWFGVSATATATTTAYATVTLGRAIFVVALLEVFTYLGQELMDRVYQNLTKRLIKFRYLENQAQGKAVVKNAAEGSVLNPNVLESMQGATCEKQGELKLSNRWIDKDAQRETVIRLAGLRAINAYLTYSSDKSKYDMALLDILSLFTDNSVVFDEKVFTRETVENGEAKVQKNTNIVDLNPGRLMIRTPELKKALKAIQSM